MREIKFSYIYQHNDTGRILNKKFDIHEIELELMGECFMWRYTLIARRQYTGLKDKNGVEIYEGDLLQSFYNDGEIHEVIWHEESASFRVATYLNNRHGGSFAELFFMDDIHENCNKIIGNIYENPELLQGN